MVPNLGDHHAVKVRHRLLPFKSFGLLVSWSLVRRLRRQPHFATLHHALPPLTGRRVDFRQPSPYFPLHAQRILHWPRTHGDNHNAGQP